VKKLLVSTVIVGFCLFKIQQSSNQLDRAVGDSVQLNEEFIELYEKRIKLDEFPDEEYKLYYKYSYAGFLNWINSYEYRKTDPEFDERLKR
jgi:hypothetical protein